MLRGVPCAHCRRIRQFVKDSAGRVFPRRTTHVEYTTSFGPILVERATNKMVGCKYNNWIGCTVKREGKTLELYDEYKRYLGTIDYTSWRKYTVNPLS
jgi:hypothetical protein